METPAREPLEIGLLLYPGVQMASVLGITDVLHYAEQAARRRHGSAGGPLLRISHWSPGAGAEPVRSYDSCPDLPGAPAMIVMPPSMTPPSAAEAARFAAWLRESHAQGTALVSICAGAFVLAATGLLAGRTITTHWFFASALQARVPDAEVETARMIVEDGDIITAGGMMAWTDLTLTLIGRVLGGAVMIDTAKAFVVDPPGRPQGWYAGFVPRFDHGDAAILRVQEWLQSIDTRDVPLDAMAAEAGLEKRTFVRRFRKATGLTSGDYLQHLRVAHAQDLLQFTTQSLSQIAWSAGYADVGTFRKVFMRVVDLSPNNYRKKFGLPE